MPVRETLKHLFRRAGYDVKKFNVLNSPLARRQTLMAYYGITLVFDVGANEGQYGQRLRRTGYRDRIVSFEPLTSAFQELERTARPDLHWDVAHFALGDHEQQATIHIAENTECSSLLNVTPRFTQSSPSAVFVATEEITVRTLDAVFHDYYRPGDTPYLKIDTQGFEKHVLDGAHRSLQHVQGVQMELSLVRLYEGETLFTDMLAYMAELGYTLMSIEPINADPSTGQLLQVDGLFFRL